MTEATRRASVSNDSEPACSSAPRTRSSGVVRYLCDRDATALERTMTNLDREEAAVQSRAAPEAVPADVAVLSLRELPDTWREAEGGKGRHLLASTLFDRIDVLEIQEATIHLSAHAVRHGLAAALPAEVGLPVSGRGERI
jgi:GAF domain-containing protein